MGSNTFVARIKEVRDARWFSNLTTAIIIFYASVLGFKTLEEASQPFGNVLYIFDWFVTIYFVIEIVIKMAAEEKFLNFLKAAGIFLILLSLLLR